MVSIQILMNNPRDITQHHLHLIHTLKIILLPTGMNSRKSYQLRLLVESRWKFRNISRSSFLRLKQHWPNLGLNMWVVVRRFQTKRRMMQRKDAKKPREKMKIQDFKIFRNSFYESYKIINKIMMN